MLWLVYANVLEFNGIYGLKYTNDTTYYKPCFNSCDPDPISDANEDAIRWSNDNFMPFNSVKTVLMNTFLSYTIKLDETCFVNGLMTA